MEKMTHALVLSDTHHDLLSIDRILQKYPDVDYVFHLGDNVSDAEYIAKNTAARVVCVKGNCDYGDNAELYADVVIRGQKIILTHGHTLNVKYTMDRAYYYALEHEAKALLFGHTHVPYCEYQNGVWLVNPGSAGHSADGAIHYAFLQIGEIGVVPKLKKL